MIFRGYAWPKKLRVVPENQRDAKSAATKAMAGLVDFAMSDGSEC